MKKWARDVRLMPIVLLAVVCLFALKTMGLFFDGGYTLGQRLGSASTLTVTTIPVPARRCLEGIRRTALGHM